MVCFRDFTDDVSVYIFNEIYNSYELKYNDYSEIIIEYNLKDISDYMSFRYSLKENDLEDYFHKFKDEFDRRGIRVKLPFYDERGKNNGKFFVDGEMFFPSLLENNHIDQKILTKYLVKQLNSLTMRVIDIEKRLNNI